MLALCHAIGTLHVICGAHLFGLDYMELCEDDIGANINITGISVETDVVLV